MPFHAVTSLGALLSTFPVGMDHQATNQQSWKDKLTIIISKNAHPPTAGIHMRVIRRGNVILATVRCMHHKRQEPLRQKPLANIAYHPFKLTKRHRRSN